MVAPSRVEIHCGPLILEGLLHLPDTTGPHPAAVICHPHPLYGGDMHNNIVQAVCEVLSLRGWVALRFNFRGVAGSQGASTGGKREPKDVIAALDFLAGRPEVDMARLSVVGYSFGAVIGLAVARADHRVRSLAAISPPLMMANFASVDAWQKPKLVIWGDDDEFVDSDALREIIGELPDPKQYRVFPGVDHFWQGRHQVAAETASPTSCQHTGSPARPP